MEKYVILGHENSDVDSIVSGILLEKYLEKLYGDKGSFEFVIAGSVDATSKKLLKDYKVDIEKYQRRIDEDDKNFILVDHHKRDDLEKVVAIVDHHPDLEFKHNLEHYYNEKATATGAIIGRWGEEKGIFNKKDIELALLAIFTDSMAFRSSRTCNRDYNWAKKMCLKYKIDFDKLDKKISKDLLTDLSDIKKASLNKLKKFDYNGLKFESSYIDVEDSSKKKKEIDEVLVEAINYFMESNLDGFVFILRDIKNNKTKAFRLTKTFNDIKTYEGYIARISVIMPDFFKEIVDDYFNYIFVVSSSRDSIDNEYLELATDMAKLLADDNYNLVFGAASMGMMGNCYKEFKKKKRNIIGNTVSKYKDDLDNLECEEKNVCDTTFDRTKRCFEKAKAVVILPGGTGSLAELFGILEENRSIDNSKKVILVNYKGYYDKVLDIINYLVENKFNGEDIYNYFEVVDDISDVKEILNNNKKMTKEKQG